MDSASERPIYTREQLAKYVRHIHGSADTSYSLEDLEKEIEADPLVALGNLQRKQLGGIPWGNIALHYSPYRTLSLDPEALFEKLVERGLGGYCMENNSFFSNVLRSLGYELYITGARISNAVEMNGKNPSAFAGWEHLVILAIIKGQKYHVDVGFGSRGALQPLPLVEGTTVESVPGSVVRLVYRHIANNTTNQKMWVFETHNSTANVWTPGYCFTELEFLPEDFYNLNYRTSRDALSWFTYRMVLSKIVLDEKLVKPLGTVTLVGNEIHQRLGSGKSETVAACETEEDRVEALEKWFNVKLTKPEVAAIRGAVTEIRSPVASV